jgi:hypothetical protein
LLQNGLFCHIFCHGVTNDGGAEQQTGFWHSLSQVSEREEESGIGSEFEREIREGFEVSFDTS